MYSEVDTFIGNHTLVDLDIYKLWIDGQTVQDAASILQQKGAMQVVVGTTMDLLLSDVNDHFRMYGMLEKLLQMPPRFNEQWTFQIDASTQTVLINNYYEFDDVVMREILGKKLSSRQRKDLDEVSDKTGKLLKSCRRQFDNAKRVYKTVEEMTGSVQQNIKTNFFLSDELVKKYAAIVFIAGNRFETSKKKLQYLTFKDFYACAHSMMSHWTSKIVDEDCSADLEREFLNELRELRNLLDREKDHKSLVCQQLKSRVSDRILTEIENNFKAYSRTLINIAYGLNHSKELKDLFIDLVEKYIEPCKQLHWPLSDMKMFLEVYTEATLQLDFLKLSSSQKIVWKRYMDGITGCLIAMYHN